MTKPGTSRVWRAPTSASAAQTFSIGTSMSVFRWMCAIVISLLLRVRKSGAGCPPAPCGRCIRSRLRFGVAQLLCALLATDLDGAPADRDLDGVAIERVIADGAGGFFRLHGGAPVMPGIGHAHGTTARIRRLSGNLAVHDFRACAASRNSVGERP